MYIYSNCFIFCSRSNMKRWWYKLTRKRTIKSLKKVSMESQKCPYYQISSSLHIHCRPSASPQHRNRVSFPQKFASLSSPPSGVAMISSFPPLPATFVGSSSATLSANTCVPFHDELFSISYRYDVVSESVHGILCDDRDSCNEVEINLSLWKCLCKL